MENQKYPRKVISILVENHFGVLARISSMFCRRSFNIESITASETVDPGVTRITITMCVDEKVLKQVLLQTQRLEEVLQVFVLEDDSIQRELLLVKVEAGPEDLAYLRNIADVFNGRMLDMSPDSMVIEVTGKPKKIDSFLNMLGSYHVMEMCRTGVTAMERGGLHSHMQKPKAAVRPES